MDTQKPEQDTRLIPVSSDDELKFKTEYMKDIIKASKLINIWPREPKTVWYHLIVCFMTIHCITFTSTLLLHLLLEGENIDKITELTDFVTVLISGTFRYAYVYFRDAKYLLLVSMMYTGFIQRPFFVCKNKISMEKYYTSAGRIVKAYTSFTIFWILQFCLVPLIVFIWKTISNQGVATPGTNVTEVSQQPPYPIIMKVNVPFDVTQQPLNALFYIYQFIGFSLFGTIYVTVDMFWALVIMLTIGQFALIKESYNKMAEILKDYNDSKEMSISEKEVVQEVEEGLKKCIKHHQFMREYVHLVDDIINPNIIVDWLHAIISIAFILLDVTIALTNSDWNKIMFNVEYFTTSITHMFIFDWLSNELAVKEEELADAIYELPWYKYPTIKTNIILEVAQSRRPYRLTGGRMFKLSLEFFTSTLRAIFSYFTFLFQIRNGTGTSKNNT